MLVLHAIVGASSVIQLGQGSRYAKGVVCGLDCNENGSGGNVSDSCLEIRSVWKLENTVVVSRNNIRVHIVDVDHVQIC